MAYSGSTNFGPDTWVGGIRKREGSQDPPFSHSVALRSVNRA